MVHLPAEPFYEPLVLRVWNQWTVNWIKSEPDLSGSVHTISNTLIALWHPRSCVHYFYLGDTGEINRGQTIAWNVSQPRVVEFCFTTHKPFEKTHNSQTLFTIVEQMTAFDVLNGRKSKSLTITGLCCLTEWTTPENSHQPIERSVHDGSTEPHWPRATLDGMPQETRREARRTGRPSLRTSSDSLGGHPCLVSGFWSRWDGEDPQLLQLLSEEFNPQDHLVRNHLVNQVVTPSDWRSVVAHRIQPECKRHPEANDIMISSYSEVVCIEFFPSTTLQQLTFFCMLSSVTPSRTVWLHFSLSNSALPHPHEGRSSHRKFTVT